MEQVRISVIGLGYVGLPLAVEFSKKFKVVGFDINQKRIGELNQGFDKTLEVDVQELKELSNSKDSFGILFSSDLKDIEGSNFYIITVPTPTDKHNHPDLTPLYRASEMIGSILKKGDIVVYESTVYPGVTEDECVPVLEKFSGLKFNQDFFVGYSPERINPGDKKNTLTKILKVTSGSTPEIGKKIDGVYNSIISAGTHLAPSIKVAEAAKVIENSQRDINIAFVNELSKIFNLLDIDTQAVLDAASTKWNFLPFKPGLVGGHCIGVDPYYLAQKAQEAGYHPEIILAGRRLNDSMGRHVVTQVVKLMMRKDLKVIKAKAIILGFTFKENCPDIRNTRVIDVYNELKSFDLEVEVYDPWVDQNEIIEEYGIETLSHKPNLEDYSAIILAVAHKEFTELNLEQNESRVVFDVKSILPIDKVDGRL